MTSWLSRLFGSAQSPSLQLFGIHVDVQNTRSDIDTDSALERLGESLAMIAQYQPIRFAHLQRDVRAIRVERYACRGAFIPSEGVIITELTFLARRDISAAPVASSILHEGVHARVHAFTQRVLGGRLNRDMAHEERLCRRAEITFGLSLPRELGESVIARAQASLELDDQGVAPTVDWNLAQQRIREVDRNS